MADNIKLQFAAKAGNCVVRNLSTPGSDLLMPTMICEFSFQGGRLCRQRGQR